MKLYCYYRDAVFFPALFIVFFCTVYATIDNFRCEWHTSKSAILMALVTSVIYVLITSILSLTIFVNKFRRMKKNLLWSFISWFLLPGLYFILIMINDIGKRIKYDLGTGIGLFYLMVMIVPFIAGLSGSFIKYRKQLGGTTDR